MYRLCLRRASCDPNGLRWCQTISARTGIRAHRHELLVHAARHRVGRLRRVARFARKRLRSRSGPAATREKTERDETNIRRLLLLALEDFELTTASSR